MAILINNSIVMRKYHKYTNRDFLKSCREIPWFFIKTNSIKNTIKTIQTDFFIITKCKKNHLTRIFLPFLSIFNFIQFPKESL